MPPLVRQYSCRRIAPCSSDGRTLPLLAAPQALGFKRSRPRRLGTFNRSNQLVCSLPWYYRACWHQNLAQIAFPAAFTRGSSCSEEPLDVLSPSQPPAIGKVSHLLLALAMNAVSQAFSAESDPDPPYPSLARWSNTPPST